MLTAVVGDSDGGYTVSGAAPVSFSVGETDMTPPIDATTCRRMSYNYVFSTFDTRPIANRAVKRGMPAAGRVRSADRKSTRLNSSHYSAARMPSSAHKKTQ